MFLEGSSCGRGRGRRPSWDQVRVSVSWGPCVVVGILAALTLARANPLAQPEPPEPEPDQRDNVQVDLNQLEMGLSDRELDRASEFLTALLREDPWSYSEAPLVYLEPPLYLNDLDNEMQIRKRSRGYRRFPYKRVNRPRGNIYEADMNMCNPTRQDVLQLLVALHEAKIGNTRRTVNFCNRKRPASAVFTNIRFIGRRK